MQQRDDRGMPGCQPGAVHSLVCVTIIYMAVAGDIGGCHEGDWPQSHMRSGLQKCERPSLPGGKRRAQASGQAIGLLSTLCSPVWMERMNNRIIQI